MNLDTRLLQGPVTRSLILFALPMILGNMLQQLYNVADTLIVGKCIGADALAAVGSAFTLMTFLNSIILGLCMGSGVLFSMLYGAKDFDRMKIAFFLSFAGIGILSLLLEIGCTVGMDPILRFMNIPPEIYASTKAYLFYIFLGIFFTFLYNYFASVLRALSDSKTPLYFLGVAAVTNIVLDLYFILGLHMSVDGAAIATLISQAFSGLGILIYVFIKQRSILPSRKHMHYDEDICRRITSYSLLTCIQQSVMNFGILLIQGLVNTFGVVTMSAFAAAVKIDSFAYMPVQDFGNAFSTYIAQNKGAGLIDRMQKGLRSAIGIAFLFCVFISVLVFVFAPQLMSLFIDSQQTQIISEGVTYLHVEGACYVGIGCLFLLYGYYRGIGKAGISVVLTVISLGTRVVLSYMLASRFGTLAIWWSIPIGWFLADAFGLAYGKWKEKAL